MTFLHGSLQSRAFSLGGETPGAGAKGKPAIIGASAGRLLEQGIGFGVDEVRAAIEGARTWIHLENQILLSKVPRLTSGCGLRIVRRAMLPGRVFTTAAEKWQAVIADIRSVHRSGRPILIGTGSIRESETLSHRLTSEGIAHRLLNALQHASEAEIIADAGQKGCITVSTNMAGRGTDIQLGPGVAELGGLHVMATERFSAQRIDRQLAGRCARQGDPGSTQVFISLEDELIQKNSPIVAAALRRFHGKHGREISSAFWRQMILTLQRRVERLSFRMRRDVLSADNWLDQNLGFAANEL